MLQEKPKGPKMKKLKEIAISIGFWFAVIVVVAYVVMACLTGIAAMGFGWYNFIFGGL